MRGQEQERKAEFDGMVWRGGMFGIYGMLVTGRVCSGRSGGSREQK